MLARKRPAQAIFHVNHQAWELNHVPLFLRWRILALRGQAFLALRACAQAQRDFQAALTILPTSLSEEQQLEGITLRIHLAEATRELNQGEQALDYYQDALDAMDASTAVCTIAAVHWGMALVYAQQGHDALLQGKTSSGQELFLHAWQHAEQAHMLYRSVADHLNADLVQCLIAQIEQAQGNVERSTQHLQRVVNTWLPSLESEVHEPLPHKLERATVVSIAARALAVVECQTRTVPRALHYGAIVLKRAVTASGTPASADLVFSSPYDPWRCQPGDLL